MKKKILFIIWSFSHGGGAEKILSNVVNNMDSEKYDIEILEYYYAGIKKENIGSNIVLHKPIIDVTRKNIFNKIKNKIIGFLITRCPSLIRKIYLNKTYDVEISFNYMIPTFLLNKKSGKKISWMHGVIYELNNNLRNKRLQKKSLENVNKIVAISKRTYDSILEVFPEYKDKLSIIHNGYEFSKIIDLSNEKKDIKKADIIFCGRFDENKNPLRLLKILKIIKEKGYDYKLGFLGVGDLQEEAEAYVKENNLIDNVYFYGYQNNPYVYMKDAKIICMTSNSEGFPTVIIEGMALGKPFVTTPVAGVDEMYDNENCGFITDDDERYANIIIKLLEDKKLYSKMSKNCVTYVKRFSIENQINRLEELINER